MTQNIFNILADDVTRLDELIKTSRTVFDASMLKRIAEVSNTNVYAKPKPDPAVIRLASEISNMEILLSESGQNFPLSVMRTQPNYGAQEVTWAVRKLQKQIPNKLLRRALDHLITGSEVTMKRDVFLDVMRASVFVVNYVDSIVNLIGYAIAFNCKSIYELSDKFNFHIIRQDYSQGELRWFYNNTLSVQKAVV